MAGNSGYTRMKTCYKCYHHAEPFRQLSKSAGIWYLGCAKCGCGVFFN